MIFYLFVFVFVVLFCLKVRKDIKLGVERGREKLGGAGKSWRRRKCDQNILGINFNKKNKDEEIFLNCVSYRAMGEKQKRNCQPWNKGKVALRRRPCSNLSERRVPPLYCLYSKMADLGSISRVDLQGTPVLLQQRPKEDHSAWQQNSAVLLMWLLVLQP